MKKRMTRLAACALVIALAGCTANEANTGNADSTRTGTSGTENSAGESDSAGASASEAREVQLFLDDEAYVGHLSIGDYVTPGDYKGIRVTVEPAAVSEEQLAYTRRYYESLIIQPEEITGRALQNGDTAQLDYSGRIKETDEVFAGGTAQGQTLEIGSGSFIDGFEEGMVGMEIGETRELELSFPDPYRNNPSLSGVPVIFTVTLNGILQYPELSDSHVEALGIEDVKTVADFRDYLREGLEEEAEAKTKADTQIAVLEAAVNGATFAEEMPARLLERYVFMLDSSAEMQASGYGVPKEDLINETLAAEGYSGTAEEFIREKAEEQVRELLLLEAIARAENLAPTEEEIADSMAGALEQTGFETVAEYETAYGVRLYDAMRDNMMAVAVRDFLVENADVTYQKP